MIKIIAASLLTFAFASAASGRPGESPDWDTYADTWVATDGLGRSLPTFADVGWPKPDRQVGIFYFLWLPGAATDHYGPYDNTKIMAADPDALSKPESPLWGPLNSFHFWGKPLFGYYRVFDPYVLRKHAQMLADAGVDAVFFDTTNSYNYFAQVDALADVWLELESRGQKVPRFVFTCRAGEGEKQANQVETIYETIYQSPKYKSLWYEWQGKPLILASPDAARLSPEVLSFFTFRAVLWPGKPRTRGMWSLDNSLPYSDGDDRLGVDGNGDLEEMAAAVAVSNAGGPMSTQPPVNSRAWRGRKDTGHLDAGPDATARGGQFQDEWDFVHARDPKFVLVYCWNEWLAQKFVRDGRVMIVDQFSESHSKDVEPMTGGHGDAYYYQMVANIRRYKGARPIRRCNVRKISLDGTFDEWQGVEPEFRDTLGDPARRDFDSFGDREPRYKNGTGHNDLKSAKVTFDADNYYFLVRTEGALVRGDGGDWMTLYIDADGDPATGWLGYDLRISPGRKIAEKNVGGKDEWEKTADVSVAIGKDGIELSLSKAAVPNTTFDFKWTDHCHDKGDWTDFTLNGDAAPNDRFNYRAVTR